MISYNHYVYLYVILYLYSSKLCTGDLTPSLVLYSPGEPEYTEILVKREHDNLTLACELRGDSTPRQYVWNYMPGNKSLASLRPLTVEAMGLVTVSKLVKNDLQLSDSGQYMCSAPPFSITKYILVQSRGPKQCARGAFWCGLRCVLAGYVCDGRTDCVHGEDEDVALCSEHVCARADRLNCSSGRCVPAAACCGAGAAGAGRGAPCLQPACCDEHARYQRLEGYMDVEYPPIYEDRHAPDDYGFIQSTIYTVTACALIFMIAVVLLVSAICKMHMKRAALRSYAHADRATRRHYSLQYAQAGRLPPCYEASRLLEAAAAAPPAARALQCDTECPPSPPAAAGLAARLSAVFSSRYRQVPRVPPADVELTVRRGSLTGPPLHDYRSPACCELDSEFYFTGPEAPGSGRELNLLATPVECFRRRSRRSTLERAMEQMDRQRLTLQLGRFQLTLPSFARERRPDTPNVAEPDGADTYTLNGRTIRLLGGDFEPCPGPPGGARPPPYAEAVRHKRCGPPPEYLSRERLHPARRARAPRDLELPPRYDELAHTDTDTGPSNANHLNNNVDSGSSAAAAGDAANNNASAADLTDMDTFSSVADTLPAIDSDVNANDNITAVAGGGARPH